MCGGLRIHADRATDPTRTKTLRQRFEGEASRRVRNIAGIVRQAVVELDVLGLKSGPVINRDPPGVGERAFAFDSTPQKVGAFMRWLNEMQRAQLLEVSQGVPVEQAGRRAWASTYVQSAYRRGLAHAAGEMRKAGADVVDRWIDTAFNRPFHADRLGIIYTRTYKGLEGITQAMDTQISRVLTEGLAEGVGPDEMARRLSDRVNKVGRTRARLLARTEVINAHADAALNAYAEAGIEGVSARAELVTAGDSRLCERCARLEGETYTVEEARGVIPVHPNCFEVGTQVLAASGWRSIDEIAIGEYVWSIEPQTLSVDLKQVTGTVRGQTDRLIWFGRVAVTEDHEMLVSRAGNQGALERVAAKSVPYHAKMRFVGASSDLVAIHPRLERRSADVACIEVADYHTLLVKNGDGAMWCGNCRCAWLPALDDMRGVELR